MNIIEFIESPNMLNDQSLSLAQRTALKAVYGLPLTGDEFQMFKEITGLMHYALGREWEEASFILGRRSGKSDKIASSIALYEACARRHKLSVGQTGVVMVVASEKKRQAKIVFQYIEHKLRRSLIRSSLSRSLLSARLRSVMSTNVSTEPMASPSCSIG